MNGVCRIGRFAAEVASTDVVVGSAKRMSNEIGGRS